jgi:geranylgeranyl diphosphate synthase type II
VNFEEELKIKAAEAEAVISRYLPKAEGFQKHIAEAMNYSMTAGGKRLRPVMMAESYRMFGGRKAVIEPFMAAIEMVHTHSLVHDDLPAIDNDLYRRGRKTTHAAYGEAMGVLCGDALLNCAYETALQAFLHPDDRERTVRALTVLTEKTGIRGMLGGQSVDVENEKKETRALSREELDEIYLHKTSALLEASLMIGAVLAGAEKGEAACLEQIGAKAGLAFQIRDDILDVTATEEELGKPVFSDEKNHKTTYVTLMGVEKASEEVERLTEEALRLLESLPGDRTFLSGLLRYLAFRKK